MADERFEVADISEALSVTIANGESLSSAINLGGMFPAKIAVPAEFDGTAMTFQGSVDDATFYNLYDTTGTEVSYTVAASRLVTPVMGDFYGLSSIKIRAGTSGAATNQTGATVIKIGLIGR